MVKLEGGSILNGEVGERNSILGDALGAKIFGVDKAGRMYSTRPS